MNKGRGRNLERRPDDLRHKVAALEKLVASQSVQLNELRAWQASQERIQREALLGGLNMHRKAIEELQKRAAINVEEFKLVKQVINTIGEQLEWIIESSKFNPLARPRPNLDALRRALGHADDCIQGINGE